MASPQTLSVEDRRLVAWWAADCAEGVPAVYEDAVPDDGRLPPTSGRGSL